MYESTPPSPAKISVNRLCILVSSSIPTLGCIIPKPSTTTFFSSSITGLFKGCAIASINSIPESNVRFVSASKVITYFISIFCAFFFLI